MFLAHPLKVVAIAATASVALVACKPAETTAPTTSEAETVVVTDPSPEVPAPVTGAWSGLDPMVGKYPRDSGLLANSPIVADLKTLLGDKYDTFVANMGTQSPLERDGEVLFTSGNKPHQGGDEAAYLIIDPTKTTLEAGLWESGKLTTYTTQGATLRKPADVQTMIANAAG